MKHTSHSMLFGLALLGATTLSALSTPASAKPDHDVKRARKEVREARKDVRRADTPEERRDAREDLRGEKRDLREEIRENHPGYRRPVVRPGIGRPVVRPVYGRGVTNSLRTFQGVVTNDLKGDDFIIRTSSGQNVHVYAAKGESGAVSKGDVVRVTGTSIGGAFRARNVFIVRNR